MCPFAELKLTFNVSMISIIIPAYNHARFIGVAINSIINQTLDKWELIIVNDGSPDNTYDVVKPFLSDPRIQYFEQINQGQSTARNVGISVAKGEFIHLLDDDDWLPPDALEWQIEFLKANPKYSAIIGGVSFVSNEGNISGTPFVEDCDVSFYDLFSGNAFASPGQVLFRKTVFDKLGGFNPALRGVDDYDFMFRLTQTDLVRSTNRLGLFYRCHSGNSSKDKLQMLISSMAIVNRNLEAISDVKTRRAMKRVAIDTYFSYAGKDIIRAFRSTPLNRYNVKGMLVCLLFFSEKLVNPEHIWICFKKIAGIYNKYSK